MSFDHAMRDHPICHGWRPRQSSMICRGWRLLIAEAISASDPLVAIAKGGGDPPTTNENGLSASSPTQRIVGEDANGRIIWVVGGDANHGRHSAGAPTTATFGQHRRAWAQLYHIIENWHMFCKSIG
jgi:hypothetical protein